MNSGCPVKRKGNGCFQPLSFIVHFLDPCKDGQNHVLFFIIRFELALYTFLAKCALCKQEHSGQGSTSSEAGMDSHSDSSNAKGKNLIDGFNNKKLETELGRLTLKDDSDGHNADHNLLVELTDCVVNFQTEVPNSQKQAQQVVCPQSKLEPGYPCNTGGSSSLNNSFIVTDATRTSCSYAEIPVGVGGSGLGANEMAQEGPSDEGSCYHLNNHSWLARDDHSGNCSAVNLSTNELISNDWGRFGMPSISWGGRVVGRRQLKGYAKGNLGVHGEDYDAFVNIFEGGSLLYCNMSFEALLNVRKQLEELEFPCKAVNDGLWLQVCSCKLFPFELAFFLLLTEYAFETENGIEKPMLFGTA